MIKTERFGFWQNRRATSAAKKFDIKQVHKGLITTIRRLESCFFNYIPSLNNQGLMLET